MMEGLGFNRYQEHRETGIDWIEQIPADWKTMKAKFLLTESNSRSVSGDENLLSLSKYHGVIRKDQMSERAGQAESLVGYKEVEAGDLVINKMQASNGLMAVSQVTGITSPDYAIYKAKKNGAARIDYICHVLRQPEYLAEIKRRAKGVMEGFIRLYTDDLFDLPIILPPLQEQQYILDFLDDKCAKIDGAVKIKEDQIALLRERRQIIIQDAVTRGLDPAAPMKDSGIDWIGQIPAHWEVKRFKHFFSTAMGETILGENLIDDGKIPVYSATEGDHFFGYVNKSRVSLSAGDLVIPARGNSIGFPKLVAAPATCSQTTIYAKKLRGISSEFVFFYLLSCKRFLFQFVQTAIPQITVDEVKNNILLLPPPQEQAELVEYCEDITQRFDGAIAIKRRQIDALNEYKTSLINAAVTGKIKVI